VTLIGKVFRLVYPLYAQNMPPLSFFVIPQNERFAEAKCSFMRNPICFLTKKKPNQIPDKIAFLKTKKRFFRNDGAFFENEEPANMNEVVN